MSDLATTIGLILGEPEHSWELTTALPTEEQQGVILLQVPPGTDRVAIRTLHEAIEQLAQSYFPDE